VDVHEIRTLAVVGSGLMGHGIAQEFAVAGYDVWITDTSDALLDRALAHIDRNLRMMTEAGVLSDEQAAAAPSRLHPTIVLQAAAERADVVIEAVYEDLDLKRQIFADLDRWCAPHAILASNTSSYMPSKLAAATQRPDRVLVAHYFNPPHLLPLVELVRGPETSDQTLETMHALYTRIGKRPALIQWEAPGFVANRLQMALLREALHIVEAGIATPQDIDLVMRSSIGRRWSVAGAFELLELIGADLGLAVASEIMPDLESRPAPPALLLTQVASGNLGVKTGRGFYDWTPETAEALRLRVAHALLEIAAWDARDEGNATTRPGRSGS
jgi:3-hydroxybutyryl-CoA dehydrogenase